MIVIFICDRRRMFMFYVYSVYMGNVAQRKGARIPDPRSDIDLCEDRDDVKALITQKVCRCNMHASTPEQTISAARSFEDKAATSWRASEGKMLWPVKPIDRTMETRTPAMPKFMQIFQYETIRLAWPRSCPSIGDDIPAMIRSPLTVFDRFGAVGLSSTCPCPKANVWARLNFVLF
jgi:hypothetical protein